MSLQLTINNLYIVTFNDMKDENKVLNQIFTSKEEADIIANQLINGKVHTNNWIKTN